MVGKPKKWANTTRGWHIDAVGDRVLPISFGNHGEARRENTTPQKQTSERTLDDSCLINDRFGHRKTLSQGII
jgi:hypothetical protein